MNQPENEENKNPILPENEMPENEAPLTDDSTRNVDRIMDVEMDVVVRFGTKDVPLREIVRFGIGTMIELERNVDEPVELLVNGYSYARGEVVVVDGYYGVRVTEIGTPEERSQSLIATL